MSLSRQQPFPPARTSVRAAREFALSTLAQWGVTARRDDIRLCVSELATNALLHAVPPGQRFHLRLAIDNGRVRIEVRDGGGGRPVVRGPDEEESTGRGLWLVRELADDYGVIEHAAGKTVWLAFKITTPEEGT